MPINSPVVNGTLCFPASSIVRRRLAELCQERCRGRARFEQGSIGGFEHQAHAGGNRRQAEIHSALNKPGLGCGSNVVSRKTNSHIASR